MSSEVRGQRSAIERQHQGLSKIVWLVKRYFNLEDDLVLVYHLKGRPVFFSFFLFKLFDSALMVAKFDLVHQKSLIVCLCSFTESFRADVIGFLWILGISFCL